MMMASGAPDGLPSAVSLSSRAHLETGMSLSIPCTTSPMFPGMLKLDKSVYSSPPPAPNIPENNVCKLIEYRGHKVAAFSVQRRELICLPQAFELFLKNLVGGLHTVYTKLKRLGIVPVVCNVEQVRILRGLGAIQPGVNRCKLIAPKEFDVLYDDCTNSSARPGRPPKRGSPSPLKESDISHFRPKQSRLEPDIPGYSPYKWMDLMKSSPLFGNGYYYPPQMAAHLPFMPHPAMMNMALGGHLPPNRPNGIPPEAPKDLSSPIKEFPLDRNKIEEMMMQREKNNNTAPPPQSVTPRPSADLPLNLNTRDVMRRASIDDSGASSDHDDISDTEVDLSSPSASPSECDPEARNANNPADRDASRIRELSAMVQRPAGGGGPLPPNTPTLPQPDIPEAGSMVALLLNVQGLLRMAIESAKHKEQKIQTEKADLRREMSRERERREHLEIQLADTQNTILSLQRKLKKEKKLLRRLNETVLQSQNLPPVPSYQQHTNPGNAMPHPPPQSQHSSEHSNRCLDRIEVSMGGEMRTESGRSNGTDHRDTMVNDMTVASSTTTGTELMNGRLTPPKEEPRDHDHRDV